LPGERLLMPEPVQYPKSLLSFLSSLSGHLGTESWIISDLGGAVYGRLLRSCPTSTCGYLKLLGSGQGEHIGSLMISDIRLSHYVGLKDGPLYTIGSSSAYLPTATYLYCSRTTLRSFAQTSSIRCRALQCPNVFGKIGAFGYLVRPFTRN
jgi:hypothetical protein